MKVTTVNSLVTARTLFDSASLLARSGDRHLCTAGLIQLQDAVELVLVAMLRELDIDDSSAIESLTFDQLVSQLRKEKVLVPKSSTIKALNKQRVIAKHYGELVEPASVEHYLEACDAALNELVRNVTGVRFGDVLIVEVLQDGEP